jgi:hypothetical protein
MSIVSSTREFKKLGTDAGHSQSIHANKVRLRAGNQWLHWSGAFLTDNPQHAWSGTIGQARACRRKFDAAAGCAVVEA